MAQASSSFDEPISPRSPPRAQSDTRLQRYKMGDKQGNRKLPELGNNSRR